MMDAHDIRSGQIYWVFDDGEHFKVNVLRPAIRGKGRWFCQNEHGLCLILPSQAFQAPARSWKSRRGPRAPEERIPSTKKRRP